MKFNVANRKVHYWASAIVALPALILLGSGLLLQAKKHWSWVQPAEHRGTGSAPALDFHQLLDSVRRHPSHEVTSWADVNRIDVRPGRGVAKVWLQSGHEVQVDLGTGRVLHSAYRRSDLIESIHDGSFFGGDWIKLGVFLPTGVVLLLLWGSGLWMWWVTFSGRRRVRAQHHQLGG
ncbi:MAG TPA: PepSY domain-containing protein [Vicinamibacterales bacterium]|nr:PepSY domain-containing protein [Vicinamibacterales bacterium]